MTALLVNKSAQADSRLHSLERTGGGIGFLVNRDKTEYMCFNQSGDISTLNCGSQKLVARLIYLGSSENDINARLAKAETDIERLLVKWRSDLSDKTKRNFFQAAIVSILLYESTTWTLT